MPRRGAKQTLSGQKAQPVSAVAGQMYGAGEDQMALQRALPAPNARVQPSAAYTPPSTGGGALSGAVRGAVQPPTGGGAGARLQAPSEAERYQQALQAAQALKGQAGILRAPSDRPTEPVTAGLRSGPGGGPEMLGLQLGSPTGATMRRLSQLTGDPYFSELAAKAGL